MQVRFSLDVGTVISCKLLSQGKTKRENKIVTSKRRVSKFWENFGKLCYLRKSWNVAKTYLFCYLLSSTFIQN